MQSLKDSSIKKKVMLVTMLAVMTAMSVACSAFVINDVRAMKSTMAEHMEALANMLAGASASAIRNGDAAALEKILERLRTHPGVESAAAYDVHGSELEAFPKSAGGKAFPMPAGIGSRFQRGRLEAAAPIVDGGQTLGTIYLVGDLDFIWRQLFQYAVIVVVVLVVSCGTAYLLASKLQRFISGPVLDLTRTAQEISQHNNYRIRVAKQGEDELGALCDEFNHMLDQVETSKQALQEAHDGLERRVDERTAELTRANAELNKEVAERQRAECELETVHREFAAAARRAGMAEIATGVLHNVGNVLNSVNVSATMLAAQLKTSKLSQLHQVVTLLDEHQAGLGEFLANDEKGRQIPRFLSVLAEHLAKEDAIMLGEAQSLAAHVEHIKAIVATQQSYAASGGLLEPTDVNAILDDAVKLNVESFKTHCVDVRREFADLPPLMADKQRIMQIVINLVKNASEALTERQAGERRLTLRTRTEFDRLILEVSDTGVGIKPENLAKVFAHGFTTKPTGHGFGLHSCANAATEMGGSLSVRSDGEFQGATFLLNLPLVEVTVAA